ncbi:hypothetical protein [Aquimarina pacifica]|uniref:hypothetical protein n=1 Tax=Aquimarina pacifica TaxID=1296415 RepID=UPI00046F4C05|nr:hypothetical protein [Aquimarina pacifica]
MKKQSFIILYLTLILFCSSHICTSQVIEYKPINGQYVGDVNRGNLHKIKGNVKSFTTRLFDYNSKTKKYIESSIRFPESYEPSKYILDKNGNIIECVLINRIVDYYKTSKRHNISVRKTNVLHEKWKELKKTKGVKEEEISYWDYLSDKKITKSLFNKEGIIYVRNKNNLDVYFIEYENKHLFDKNGNIKNPDNKIKSKKLLYKFKYNDFNKVEKCENFNGDKQIWNYFYDKKNNLIREDIYSYSEGKFYELEMKTYLLNDKNDVIKKKIYQVYVYQNPYDESTILNKLLDVANGNKETELKYNTQTLEYSYEYDVYDNWTTKFYPSFDIDMKVVRKFEYYK